MSYTLFNYQQQVQLLLSDIMQETYNPADLTTYINEARYQVAADGECLRQMVAGVTAQGGPGPYTFTGLTNFNTGVGGAINVRNIWYQISLGQQYICPKPFEWYGLYYFNNPLATQGPPDVWAQQAQGTQGSFFIGPVPDAAYNLVVDAVCYPSPLGTNLDLDVLPTYWNDCVQFLACFYALLNGSQPDEAEKMRQRYLWYQERARKFANPSLLPGIWMQAQDRTLQNKLGVQPAEANG
jgi:hypothetical protein